MIFSAKLKKGCHIHQKWVAARSIANTLHGVRFKKHHAGYFYAEDIDADKVPRLDLEPCVDVIVVTNPTGIVEVAEVSTPLETPVEEPETDEETASVDPTETDAVPAPRPRGRPKKIV